MIPERGTIDESYGKKMCIRDRHDPDVELSQIREDLIEHVIKPVVDANLPVSYTHLDVYKRQT